VSAAAPTRWGSRAAALYDESYAARYREHDETAQRGATVVALGSWLRRVCERFARPIDVLDLGCGTGRYFHALVNVRRLVGIDVSAPMLARASRPIGEVDAAAGVTLVHADFLRHDFAPGEFDVVYSIGVLGEHAPFDASIAARVKRWLAPGGRFAFTTVHPLSPSVPRTIKRRIGERLLPVAPSAWRRGLRDRLMADGLYADEERVRDVLNGVDLPVESIEAFRSDVHLHVRAIARAYGGRS
jgi:SAM-dependent methyltransferase